MIELKKEELMNIEGGVNWLTSGFLNSAARLLNTLLDLGRSVGNAIIRTINGNYCSF